jgi:hypothetical protein
MPMKCKISAKTIIRLRSGITQHRESSIYIYSTLLPVRLSRMLCLSRRQWTLQRKQIDWQNLSIFQTFADPLPITLRYAKAGLPLYVVEEQPDNRLEGGDFADVKSVSAMDKQQGTKEQTLDPTKPTQCHCGMRLCDCV